MAGPNPVAPQYSKSDLRSAYSSLLNDLNDAYWAAGDLNVKDQIYGNIEAVGNLLSQLDATDLTTRDAQYSALTQQVGAVNKALSNLQQQINTMISRINTAATIAADIAKVLAIAAKVIPGI